VPTHETIQHEKGIIGHINFIQLKAHYYDRLFNLPENKPAKSCNTSEL